MTEMKKVLYYTIDDLESNKRIIKIIDTIKCKYEIHIRAPFFTDIPNELQHPNIKITKLLLIRRDIPIAQVINPILLFIYAFQYIFTFRKFDYIIASSYPLLVNMILGYVMSIFTRGKLILDIGWFGVVRNTILRNIINFFILRASHYIISGNIQIKLFNLDAKRCTLFRCLCKATHIKNCSDKRESILGVIGFTEHTISKLIDSIEKDFTKLLIFSEKELTTQREGIEIETCNAENFSRLSECDAIFLEIPEKLIIGLSQVIWRLRIYGLPIICSENLTTSILIEQGVTGILYNNLSELSALIHKYSLKDIEKNINNEVLDVTAIFE